jgi:NADH dehydrogenase
MNQRKKVVVIGGGFAGIQLIRNLDEAQFDVILIDKINHHQFGLFLGPQKHRMQLN